MIVANDFVGRTHRSLDGGAAVGIHTPANESIAAALSAEEAIAAGGITLRDVAFVLALGNGEQLSDPLLLETEREVVRWHAMEARIARALRPARAALVRAVALHVVLARYSANGRVARLVNHRAAPLLGEPIRRGAARSVIVAFTKKNLG